MPTWTRTLLHARTLLHTRTNLCTLHTKPIRSKRMLFHPRSISLLLSPAAAGHVVIARKAVRVRELELSVESHAILDTHIQTTLRQNNPVLSPWLQIQTVQKVQQQHGASVMMWGYTTDTNEFRLPEVHGSTISWFIAGQTLIKKQHSYIDELQAPSLSSKLAIWYRPKVNSSK